MADRTAKLTLALELLNQGKVADGMAVIRKEIEAGGDAAKAAAGALGETAVAAGEVAAAETDAADATARLAGALSSAGDAAEESGQRQAQAALQSAQAVEGVTASVGEQAAATREAGAAAVDSNEDVQGAVRATGNAVDKLTQEWKEEIQAAQAAGVAFDGATAAEAIDKLTDMIVKSGDSAENIKAALEGLADGIAEEYRSVGDAAEEAGTEQAKQGKSIETALAAVRVKIGEVDSSMRGMGDAAAQGGGEVRSSFLSVDEALALLNKSADDATEALRKTGILPKAALAELPKLIETVTIAMERTAGTSEAATDVQLANLDAVKAKLTELTVVTNRQTNAASDNAVSLQETGSQVEGLTSALSGLLGVTGNSSTIFGTAIQKIGAGASAYERAKDAITALNLNTINLSGSMATLGAQGAALAAAFSLGAKVGLEFSKTSSANRQEIDRLMASLSTLKDDILGGTINRLGATQDALQKVAVSAATFGQEVQRLNVYAAKSELENLSEDLQGVALSMVRGGEATKAYYSLLNAGFESTRAHAAILADHVNIIDLYTRAQTEGGESINLWNQAIERAAKTPGGLTEELKRLKVALDEQMKVTQADIEAKRMHATAIEHGTNAIRNLAIAQREYVTAEQEAMNIAAAALASAQTRIVAVDGSTAAINALVASIAEMSAESDRNSVSLAEHGTALMNLLSNVSGLSAAERQRIVDLAELSKRGNELTVAERAYVAQLAESIENGNGAVAVTRERVAATAELAEAVRQLTGSEMLAIAADAARVEGIQREIEHVRQLIAEEERRQGIRQEETAINMDAGASLDYLRMREAQLQREQENGITIVRAASAAKVEEQDERTKLAAIIEREKAASEGAASAHSNIVKILRDGKEVWTNVTEEQRRHAEKTIEVTTAHEKLGVAADTSLGAMQSLLGTVPNLTENMDSLKAKAEEVQLAFDKMADSINRANSAAAAAAK